jgi:hypothetical protein
MTNRDHPANCAVCGSPHVARIIYGFVDIGSIATELDSGRAVLGGCDVSESSCRWHCHACRHEWGDFVLEFGELNHRNQEDRARRDTEALARGVVDAPIYPDGWVHCPYCDRSFNTTARVSWNGEKHMTCGTFLRLVPSE